MTILSEQLHKSMSEESLAARRYRQRADVAERHGDSVTARLYRHIAHEEDIHYSEFKARLSRLPRRQ